MGSKHTILIVDDEKNILDSLNRLLRSDGYSILTASSGDEGLEILSENEVQIIISDQRMPGMNGTEFLSKVKDMYPDTIRTILSGYTEVDSITDSINKGNIYKFFLKPWNDQKLRLEIRHCIDKYELTKKNKELTEIIVKKNDDLEKMNKELKRINDNLEVMVRQRTRDLEIQNQALELSRAIFEDMPLPALGISSDGMIAMSNKMASDISSSNARFQVGCNISEYLHEEDRQVFEIAVASAESKVIERCFIMGKEYKILIAPLLGQFKGKGATIVLI